ncbi:(2Fe-2S)-binding protein [Agrobacterium larrymoorei]|uniref:(2Fe-2S)-binding protein n=1 Tax=Agrobacterium larrymoorei TaxID=160699 RepID=UPI00286A5DE0|nr:(2Fe-2S)-binding protein [Agrobacterium larrymoorei]
MEDLMFRSVLERPGKPSDMTVLVNGVETPAWKGETVASVLLRVPDAGRTSPVSGNPRLPYCQMGICFECLAIVDGIASTQGCLVPVRPGMRIESQRGPRGISR